MKFRIFTTPQPGADYQILRNVAVATEELGFDAFFRSDHYLKMGDGSGLPSPTDAWTTLAGLAIETSRIRLGTLMSPAAFRLPGPLAITVAQVDQMSGGRVRARPRDLRGGRALPGDHDLLGRADGVLRRGRSRVPPSGRRRRATAIGREPADMREHGLGGTPGEVTAKIAEYAEIGAERVYLQVLDLGDLDHLALIASDVVPQF